MTACHTHGTTAPTSPAPATVAAPVPSATSQSALFERLPAEIRQRILIEAFGD